MSSTLRSVAPALGVLIVLCGLTFLPLFDPSRAFVSWDDTTNIVENEAIHELDAQSLSWALSAAHLGVYEPVSWWMKTLEIHLFGLAPRTFHVLSLVMHTLSAGLLFAIARRVLACALPAARARDVTFGALGAALLWALHPLRTEVVAWASGQSYAQAGLFYMASLYAYLRRAERSEGGTGWLVASVLLYACAVMSKSAAIALPVALVALDVYPLRRFRARRAWLEKSGYVAVATGAVVLAWLATAGAQEGNAIELDAAQKVARAAFAVCAYLGRTVWPVDLVPHEGLPLYGIELLHPRFLLPALAVVTTSAAAVMLFRRHPWFAVAWAVFLGTLLPVLGFVQHGVLALAFDRYTYLSTIPIACVAGAAVVRIVGRHPRFVAAVAAVVLATLGTLTRRQLDVWRDTESLWRHTLAIAPGNGFAANNLGHHLMEEERYDEARAVLAVGYDTGYRNLKLVLNLGVTLERLGRIADSAALYEENLPRYPDSAAIHNNLAIMLLNLGRPLAALPHLERTVELDPTIAGAVEHLERLRARLGEAPGP